MSYFRRLLTPTNIIIAGLVALTMLYVLVDYVRNEYFGAEVGESCATASDCKGSGTWCLDKADKSGKYCSKQCVADSQCPAKWTCGDSGFTSQIRYKSGATGAKRAVNVCWMDQKVPMSR